MPVQSQPIHLNKTPVAEIQTMLPALSWDSLPVHLPKIKQACIRIIPQSKTSDHSIIPQPRPPTPSQARPQIMPCSNQAGCPILVHTLHLVQAPMVCLRLHYLPFNNFLPISNSSSNNNSNNLLQCMNKMIIKSTATMMTRNVPRKSNKCMKTS